MFLKPFLPFWSIQKQSSHASKQSLKQNAPEGHVRWVQHMDANGFYYYEDATNDTVTWMAPVGEDFIPWAVKSHAPKQSSKPTKPEVHARWVQHMDIYGYYYYEDTINGIVTWMAPIGEVYIPWAEIKV